MARKKINVCEKEDSFKEPSEDTIYSDLTIDKFNLDNEAATIGEKIRKYGFLLSRTKEMRRKASMALEIAEYEISSKIRSNLKEWGITKDTDATVMRAVKSTEEWQDLYQKLNKIRRREEDYTFVVNALQSNTYMITTLTNQWINNYYIDDRMERKESKQVLSTHKMYRD